MSSLVPIFIRIADIYREFRQEKVSEKKQVDHFRIVIDSIDLDPSGFSISFLFGLFLSYKHEIVEIRTKSTGAKKAYGKLWADIQKFILSHVADLQKYMGENSRLEPRDLPGSFKEKIDTLSRFLRDINQLTVDEFIKLTFIVFPNVEEPGTKNYDIFAENFGWTQEIHPIAENDKIKEISKVFLYEPTKSELPEAIQIEVLGKSTTEKKQTLRNLIEKLFLKLGYRPQPTSRNFLTFTHQFEKKEIQLKFHYGKRAGVKSIAKKLPQTGDSLQNDSSYFISVNGFTDDALASLETISKERNVIFFDGLSFVEQLIRNELLCGYQKALDSHLELLRDVKCEDITLSDSEIIICLNQIVWAFISSNNTTNWISFIDAKGIALDSERGQNIIEFDNQTKQKFTNCTLLSPPQYDIGMAIRQVVEREIDAALEHEIILKVIHPHIHPPYEEFLQEPNFYEGRDEPQVLFGRLFSNIGLVKKFLTNPEDMIREDNRSPIRQLLSESISLGQIESILRNQRSIDGLQSEGSDSGAEIVSGTQLLNHILEISSLSEISVILGDTGSGKTWTSYFFHKILLERTRLDSESTPIPIFIRFSSFLSFYNSHRTSKKILKDFLGEKITQLGSFGENQNRIFKQIANFLQQNSFFFIIDALDELLVFQSQGNPNIRELLRDFFQLFLTELKEYKIPKKEIHLVITSRRDSFYEIESFITGVKGSGKFSLKIYSMFPISEGFRNSIVDTWFRYFSKGDLLEFHFSDEYWKKIRSLATESNRQNWVFSEILSNPLLFSLLLARSFQSAEFRRQIIECEILETTTWDLINWFFTNVFPDIFPTSMPQFLSFTTNIGRIYLDHDWDSRPWFPDLSEFREEISTIKLPDSTFYRFLKEFWENPRIFRRDSWIPLIPVLGHYIAARALNDKIREGKGDFNKYYPLNDFSRPVLQLFFQNPSAFHLPLIEDLTVRIGNIGQSDLNYDEMNSLIESYVRVIGFIPKSYFNPQEKYYRSKLIRKILDLLIECLARDDWKISLLAAIALGKIGEAVVDTLLQLLENPNPQVRNFAAISFLFNKDPRGIPPMAKLLEENEYNFVIPVLVLQNYGIQAIDSLMQSLEIENLPRGSLLAGMIGKMGPMVSQRIIRKLEDPNPIVRRNAIMCCLNNPDFDRFDLIEKSLADPNLEVRIVASVVLALNSDHQPLDLMKIALGFQKEIPEGTSNLLSNFLDMVTKEKNQEFLKTINSFVGNPLERIKTNEFSGLKRNLQDSVMKLLGVLFGAPSNKNMIGLLENPDPNLRKIALVSLTLNKDLSLIPQLVQLLGNEDEEISMYATQILGGYGETALDALIDALHNPNFKNRTNLIVTLQEIKLPRAVDTLLQLMEEEDEEIAFSAAFALGTMGSIAIDSQIRKLQDKNPQNRRLAAFSLEFNREPEAIPYLIGLLDDEDNFVRVSAVSALVSYGEIVIDYLLPYLGTQNQRFGSFVAFVLSKLGTPSIPKLIPKLRDHNFFVRKNAIKAFSNNFSAKIVLPLVEYLGDDNEDIRDSAKITLQSFGTEILPEFKGYLEEKPLNEIILKQIGTILNHLAWKIYSGGENTHSDWEKGLNAIDLALSIEEKPAYFDTKACLLNLFGQYNDARDTFLDAVNQINWPEEDNCITKPVFKQTLEILNEKELIEKYFESVKSDGN